MKRVEIIGIGKEILRGQTLDTNSSWLARRVTALGGLVGRIVVPDDDVGAIVQEIKKSFDNGAEVIITTGGLGPTDDDLTRQAIAGFLGVDLVLNEDLLENLRQFFERRGFAMAERNVM